MIPVEWSRSKIRETSKTLLTSRSQRLITKYPFVAQCGSPRAEQKKFTMANKTNIGSKDSKSYNITGENWDRVVKILNSIVNGEDYLTNAVFSIIISPASSHLQHPQEFQKKFQLTAKPTDDQPGNGLISIRQGSRYIGRPYNEEMVKDLEEMYGDDTSAFARHLTTLFQKNETIAKYPFVTSELYMLLLFEIGRRSVKDSPKSTLTKKKLDKLPIKKAIQGILKLLGNKKCKFGDVFLKIGKFHCFSGTPEQRETAAEEIKKALSTAEGRETESEINGSLLEQFQGRLTLGE